MTDGGKSFEQGAALSGATDVASAVTKLYAFCDTGKGGDPATCKTEGLAALQKIKIIRVGDLKDCTARLRIVDGEAAIEIGDNCGSSFPTDSTKWQEAIDTAATLAERSATVQGATDLASTKAALYAFCDSGKGGNPVTCKEDADALLSAPILRTGTSCTPTITTVGGKPAIVVGPNCQKPFPDDPTLRASVLGAADTQAQLVTALNGATDLTAATKALYAYCDSGKAGDPVACKKAADAVLRDTPVVRTGTECTAAVANEGGKPVIVIGPNCAATAFPDDPTARANTVQQAATANVAPVTPPPATPSPATPPPASSSTAPPPTSASAPNKPPVVKPEVVKPEVVKPEVVKPEVVKPEVVKPEVVKPEVVKPEVVEPPAEKKATEPM